MATLRDRDQEWLTEIAKLGQQIADDAGGSQAIQAAIVQGVIEVMSRQDTAQRSTYQFRAIDQIPVGNVQPKRSL